MPLSQMPEQHWAGSLQTAPFAAQGAMPVSGGGPPSTPPSPPPGFGSIEPGLQTKTPGVELSAHVVPVQHPFAPGGAPGVHSPPTTTQFGCSPQTRMPLALGTQGA